MSDSFPSPQNESFDDPLDPLFFDIDEAFFDDFFNIDEPSTTEEESVDTNLASLQDDAGSIQGSEAGSVKRKTAPGSVVSHPGAGVNNGSAVKKTRKEFVSEEVSRIPKSDIRRSYPKLIVEHFNKEQIKADTIKFLERIALSDLLVTHRFVGGPNPTGPSSYDVKGIPAIAAFWETHQQAVPDAVFEILETKFRVSSTDRRSAILCKWIYKGTKIMSMSGFEEGSDEKVTLTSVAPTGNPRDSTDLYGNTVLNVETVAGSNGNGKGKHPSTSGSSSTPPPQQGSSTTPLKKFGLANSMNEKTLRYGTLTFQLNSAKKIYRLEFVYSNKNSAVN